MKENKRQPRSIAEVSHFFLSKQSLLLQTKTCVEDTRKVFSSSLPYPHTARINNPKHSSGYSDEGGRNTAEIIGKPKKLSVGFIIIDRHRIMRFVNGMAREMLGLTEPEVLGQFFNFFIEINKVCEVSIVRRDGKSGIGAMHMGEIVWEGQPMYFAVLRDITKSWRQKGKILASGGERGIRTLGGV